MQGKEILKAASSKKAPQLYLFKKVTDALRHEDPDAFRALEDLYISCQLEQQDRSPSNKTLNQLPRRYWEQTLRLANDTPLNEAPAEWHAHIRPPEHRGEYLRAARYYFGMTQEDMARELRLRAIAPVAHWEAGNRPESGLNDRLEAWVFDTRKENAPFDRAAYDRLAWSPEPLASRVTSHRNAQETSR